MDLTTATAEPRSTERLRMDVVRTRAALATTRRSRQGILALDQTLAARHALVVALEAYAGRLATHGCPLPYRLRDEMRVQRQALSAR